MIPKFELPPSAEEREMKEARKKKLKEQQDCLLELLNTPVPRHILKQMEVPHQKKQHQYYRTQRSSSPSSSSSVSRRQQSHQCKENVKPSRMQKLQQPQDPKPEAEPNVAKESSQEDQEKTETIAAEKSPSRPPTPRLITDPLLAEQEYQLMIEDQQIETGIDLSVNRENIGIGEERDEIDSSLGEIEVSLAQTKEDQEVEAQIMNFDHESVVRELQEHLEREKAVMDLQKQLNLVTFEHETVTRELEALHRSPSIATDGNSAASTVSKPVLPAGRKSIRIGDNAPEAETFFDTEDEDSSQSIRKTVCADGSNLSDFLTFHTSAPVVAADTEVAVERRSRNSCGSSVRSSSASSTDSNRSCSSGGSGDSSSSSDCEDAAPDVSQEEPAVGVDTPKPSVEAPKAAASAESEDESEDDESGSNNNSSSSSSDSEEEEEEDAVVVAKKPRETEEAATTGDRELEELIDFVANGGGNVTEPTTFEPPKRQRGAKKDADKMAIVTATSTSTTATSAKTTATSTKKRLAPPSAKDRQHVQQVTKKRRVDTEEKKTVTTTTTAATKRKNDTNVQQQRKKKKTTLSSPTVAVEDEEDDDCDNVQEEEDDDDDGDDEREEMDDDDVDDDDEGEMKRRAILSTLRRAKAVAVEPRPKRSAFEPMVKSVVSDARPFEKGEDPCSISKPSRVTKLAPLNRKIPNARKTPQHFTNVMFIDNESQDPFILPEGVECAYSQRLDLVLLKTLRPNIQVAKTNYGTALLRLSQSYIDACIHKHFVTNNARTDLLVYPFVYGAVPTLMKDCAEWLITLCEKDYNEKMPELRRRKNERGDNHYVPLYDGEIEYMTYNYWQLSTQDLVNWHNDSCRKNTKNMLAYAWSLLRNQDLKRDIKQYAQFNVNDYVTAECMLCIKRNFSSIILDIQHNTQAIYVWNSFMRQCGVHHYQCHHTVQELYNRIGKAHAGIAMIYQQERSLSQKVATSQVFVNATDVYSMFRPLGIFASVGQISRDLQIVINNMVFWVANSFAMHLIGFGIASSMSVINEHIVAGFCSKFRRYLVQIDNVAFRMNSTMQNAFSNTIVQLLYQYIPEESLKYKITDEALLLLVHLIRKLLTSAVSTSIMSYQPDDRQRSGESWARALTHDLEIMYARLSTDFNSPDDWIKHDDSDLEYFDEKNQITIPWHDSEVDSEPSDEDSSSDLDENEIEEIKAELASLNRPYNFALSIDSHQLDTMTKTTAIKSISSSSNGGGGGGAKRQTNSKGKSKSAQQPQLIDQIGDDALYQFCSKACPRCRCVLCWGPTTTRLVEIIPDLVSVPACVPCVVALNEQNIDPVIVAKRVAFSIHAPICFVAGEDSDRKYLSTDDLHMKKTRVNYNRVLREVMDTYARKERKVIRKAMCDAIINNSRDALNAKLEEIATAKKCSSLPE